jgi:uncharacterized protein (TIGR04222 family)
MTGPILAWAYLAGAAVIVIGVLVWRRRLDSGPGTGAARPPEPVEVGYLDGGPALAVAAALAALRSTSAIDAGPGGALQISGPTPDTAGDLERAVHDAAGRRATPGGLAGDPQVVAALDAMRVRLTREGWLHGRRTRRHLRGVSALIVAWAAVGLVGIIVGTRNGRPVGYLAIATALVAVVGLPLLLSAPKASRAARRYAYQLRITNPQLAPKNVPSLAAYGSGAAALSVALYGTAALWAADPAFASQARIAREAASRTAG